MGASDLKNRTVLSGRNMFDKAMHFHMFRMGRAGNMTLQRVLLKMLQTGKYTPAATWIMPTAGRGMDVERANALWRVCTEPKSTSPEDVVSIFFNEEPPHDFRYHHRKVRARLALRAAVHHTHRRVSVLKRAATQHDSASSRLRSRARTTFWRRTIRRWRKSCSRLRLSARRPRSAARARSTRRRWRAGASTRATTTSAYTTRGRRAAVCSPTAPAAGAGSAARRSDATRADNFFRNL